MTIFKLRNRIDVGPCGFWPIEFPYEWSTSSTTSISSLKFDELPDPDPQMIAVENPGTGPALLPAGLIIEGLNQSRMIPVPTAIPAKKTIGANVFCVEENRFGNFSHPVLGGRAPAQFWLAKRDTFHARKIERRTPKTEQVDLWGEIRALSDALESDSQLALGRLLSEKRERGRLLDIPIDQWGESRGFALEIEGSILKVEVFANSEDAHLVAQLTATGYQRLIEGPILFEDKKSATAFVGRVMEGSLDTFPEGDFHKEEQRTDDGRLLHYEFTNFQNRTLLLA